jgi:hypothetical protein
MWTALVRFVRRLDRFECPFSRGAYGGFGSISGGRKCLTSANNGDTAKLPTAVVRRLAAERRASPIGFGLLSQDLRSGKPRILRLVALLTPCNARPADKPAAATSLSISLMLKGAGFPLCSSVTLTVAVLTRDKVVFIVGVFLFERVAAPSAC